LVELLLAGVITAFVLGAVSLCLRQLSDAKGSSRLQLAAYLRADSALSMLRSDLATVLRDRDLFWTRVLLTDTAVQTPLGLVDRDEVVVFNSRLRPVHDLDFAGDGIEFETQYRIEEDALGPVLWKRRDAVPDEYPLGGGVANPVVGGIVGLSMEAYDGDLWYQEWDSDWDGLPLAVRVTVIASGHSADQDPFDAPLVTLRTVIPIDRVPPPIDESALEDEQEETEETEESPDDGEVPEAGDIGVTGDVPEAGGGGIIPGGTGTPAGSGTSGAGPSTSDHDRGNR
jgi:hypothetical protein